MTPGAALTRLASTRDAIASLVRATAAGQAHWKPEPTKWSVLEVICHLADEEREDFRTRIRRTLEDPALPWPAIDPPRWVEERGYASRQLGDALDDFLTEREASLSWLETCEMDGLGKIHNHPSLGPMSVGDLLASWVAHDLLHIRQLARLHHEFLDHEDPHAIGYAGGW